MQDKMNPATPIFIFDFCLLILQFFYQREYIREQEGQPPSLWGCLLLHKFREPDDSIIIEDTKLLEDRDKITFYRLKQEHKMRETETADSKENELSVENDIYMLAFVAQLNSEEIEPESGYIDRMHLLSQERAELFVCAMKVAAI